ncbi:NUDIX hydrolase [Streptomyces sp. NPDC059994]|uniref:NUDIX hydrolase n=1 Tax=Streptomyces sp. NPDC059994 TaxID=3347029 RepID=UPI0036799DD2
MTETAPSAADLAALKPLAAVIETAIRDTPIRLGTADWASELAAQVLADVAAYMGRQLPDTPGLARHMAEVDAERQRQIVERGEERYPDMSGGAEVQRDARTMFARYAANYHVINGGVFDPRDDDPRQDWTSLALEAVYATLAATDPAEIRAGLVQSAAVVQAWIHDLDTRQETR